MGPAAASLGTAPCDTPPAASRRPMCSLICDSTARTARRTAFLIARGELLPCEMMLTPYTPSSGAPPCSE